MTDTLNEATAAVEEVLPPSVDPGTADIPEPEDKPNKPRRIKRKLKTKDVKRLMKTFGRVREMQAYKNQARYNVARAEAKKLNIEIDDVEVETPAFDFMTLLLTQATDDALSELNMLFADLCEIKPKVQAGASKWDIEEAINRQIEEEDIDFYTDVLDDLNDFGGLEGFLKALIRSIRSMEGTAKQLST